MKTYISLLCFTDQGVRAIKDSPPRADAFRKKVEAAGVKVVGLYWTTGQFDGVLILQADDEMKVLRAIAELASAGNVRPQSLRAFDAIEFGQIVGA
jgi:uncharacterized protein with GYD domain